MLNGHAPLVPPSVVSINADLAAPPERLHDYDKQVRPHVFALDRPGMFQRIGRADPPPDTFVQVVGLGRAALYLEDGNEQLR